MPIADWFKAREGKQYTAAGRLGASGVPDGVWAKCDSCGQVLYEGELAESLRVCRACDHHLTLTAPQRIELLVDQGCSFAEVDANLTPGDPLEFDAVKPYTTSLASARDRSELEEAVVTGRATIGGHRVVIGVMDFRFVGASMGSVVGEKIARAFEIGLAEDRPVVLVVASGGARMQEGMLSLMQMAKTSAAAERLAAAGIPYISVLTNPTYGGVTASFAVLADIVLAEPQALIGFTGQRIIEQTIRQKLPKGFQTAEFLLECGFIDEVVHRTELKERLTLFLDYLHVKGGESS